MPSKFRHHAIALAVCATLVLVEFIAMQVVAGPRTAMADPAFVPCSVPAAAAAPAAMVAPPLSAGPLQPVSI